MPTLHKNFRPPAGSVIDANDSRLVWNGSNWMLNGKKFTVPSSHRLIGKPGGPLAGWTYDWKQKGWVQPDASARPASPPPAARPPISRPPVPSQPPRFPVIPRPTQPVPTMEVPAMEKKPATVIDSLIQHPVAPVLGGLMLLAAHLTEEPQPPTIPENLPEQLQKQWQMVFNQNQQRFARRMEMYENIGRVLLGYSSTQAVLSALPPRMV